MVTIKTLSTIGKIGAGVTIAGVLYDAHRNAKRSSAVYAHRKEGDALVRSYMNSRVLDTPSKIKSDYKDFVKDLQWRNSARPFANATVGYYKGFGRILTDAAIPTALATATLLLPKGLPSAISAGGLALYGIYDFLKTTFNIGANGRYNRY